MGGNKPGLLLMCHGDFPWNFFTDPRNRKLYEDCLETVGDISESARFHTHDDEFSRLSSAMAASVADRIELNGVEVSYLGFKRPGVRQAIAHTTAKGSRYIVCAGAAGFMTPCHSTSEHVPGELQKVLRDNPALDVAYAEPCLDAGEAASLIQRSVEHAFGVSRAEPEQPLPIPDRKEDTGVVLVSAPDYDIQPGDRRAAEFARTATMLSNRSFRWHQAGIGSEASEFMENVSTSLRDRGFSAVEAGFIDFASPGIGDAAMRLVEKGASHIVATGVPALLHRHPLSVVGPQEAVDGLREMIPYADIVYVKPDPEPIAGMLATHLTSKVLAPSKTYRSMKPKYKRSFTF